MLFQALSHRLRRRSRAAETSTPAVGTCPCPLGQVPAGCRVRVASSGVDTDGSARLRDLGVCEGCCLRVVRNDLSGVIVAIGGGRLGLPSDLAHQVLVQHLVPAEVEA